MYSPILPVAGRAVVFADFAGVVAGVAVAVLLFLTAVGPCM